MAAYTAGAEGWVKERFLRQRRYIPQLTVGAESSDVIAVSISLTTYQESRNDYVAADEAIDCLVELIEQSDSLLATHTSEADFSPTTGTAVTTDDRALMVVTSTAAGAIVLDVTDQAGASGKTFLLKVTPMGVPGFPAYALLTFD